MACKDISDLVFCFCGYTRNTSSKI